MDNNKIRLRNLDHEVIDYFKKTEDKISFDDLESNIVEEIKTDASSGLAYNDEELRNRIITIEDTYVKTADGDNKYAFKSDTYDKSQVDSKFSSLSNVVDGKLDQKLSISAAEIGYIKNDNNVITETMLSTDLQNKVNARYENKRPEDGSGSEVSISDFNMLKVAVTTNTTNINNILASYVTKSSVISKAQLDADIQKVLDTARTTDIKINEADLDETLVTKINGGGGVSSTDSLVYELVNSFKGEYGQLFYARTDENGDSKIIPRYMYAEEVLLVSKSSDLTAAKSYSLSHDYDYVGDMANNELLYYSSEQTWEVYEEEPLFEYILGRFTLDYSTGNVYYGSDETNSTVFIDTTVYETKTAHQSDINSLTGDIDSLETEISNVRTTHNTDKTAIDNELSTLNTALTNLTSSLNQLKTTVSNNKNDVDSSVSDINADISTLNDSITTINESLNTIATEITDIKARLTALEPEDTDTGGTT